MCICVCVPVCMLLSSCAHSIVCQSVHICAEHHQLLLRGGRGACFAVEPVQSDLPPFSSRTVTLRALSDMWGQYRDRLVIKVHKCLSNCACQSCCTVLCDTMMFRPEGLCQLPTSYSSSKQLTKTFGSKRPAIEYYEQLCVARQVKFLYQYQRNEPLQHH